MKSDFTVREEGKTMKRLLYSLLAFSFLAGIAAMGMNSIAREASAQTSPKLLKVKPESGPVGPKVVEKSFEGRIERVWREGNRDFLKIRFRNEEKTIVIESGTRITVDSVSRNISNLKTGMKARIKYKEFENKMIALSVEAKAPPSQKTVRLKIPATAGPDYATQARFIASRIDGVKSVESNPIAHSVTITFDDTKTNGEAITRELKKEGIPVIGKPEYIVSDDKGEPASPPATKAEAPKAKPAPAGKAAASPPPVAAPAPAPAPPKAQAPAPAEAVSAFWNTWFEDRDDKSRVEELRKDEVFSFVLDISRFPYFRKYAAEVGPSIQGVFDKARAQGITTIRFRIRPILHGDFLRFTDNQRAWEELKVNLNKLVKADSAVEEKIGKKWDEFRASKIKVNAFASEVQAGEVRFDLLAERSGDARITITIWDEKGMIPLDHLSVSVRVIDDNAPTATQGRVSYTVPLKAGNQALLNISSDFSTAGPLTADAAFYVFEKGPHGTSTILFAAKKEAETPGASEEVSVYAWETVSLLSNYIEDRLQLIKLIRDAREKATSRDENVRKYSYQLVAEELREKIFSGLSERDQEQAATAEEVFRDHVSKNGQRSVVFARMRNKDGNPVYLPLGILAANSSNPILGKRIILVQPLPRERYPAGTHPVNTWTFNVPNNLPELEGLTNLELGQLQKNPPYRRDISTVRSYFEEVVSLASEASPEGVMLLSHQAGGNLWFTNEADRITTEKIKRKFPAGSVAILSACSAASSEGNNQAILERLNRNGIDAMIISPFPVDAEYGAVLAIHFVQAIENAKKNSQAFSVAELFSMASEQTAKHFKEKQTINFEDMDLEFLIAGDYRIRIAPK
jgi:hypothetical protein